MDTSASDSERDLTLKIAARRLFWTMGCSTRLDVRLRAYVAGQTRGSSWQEFTDLDVLGVGFTPAGQLHLTLADCKTSRARAIERMFWVRGVSDFFDADEAFLVRSQAVPAAARALSTRLGIGVLDPDDLSALATTFHTALDLEGPLSILFESDTVRQHLALLANLDKRLDPLVQFVLYDYWVYEPYRNASFAISRLQEVVKYLDGTNPDHRGLFYECAWLYTLTLARVSQYVRSSRMADVPTAVRTFVAGGELALREKGQLAGLLERVGFVTDAREVELPPYIEILTELATRFLAQPAEVGEVLRYAEFLATGAAARQEFTVGQAFGEHVRPIAAKLLADVCGYLVAAAGLRPEFRISARELLVVDLTSKSDQLESQPPPGRAVPSPGDE